MLWCCCRASDPVIDTFHTFTWVRRYIHYRDGNFHSVYPWAEIPNPAAPWFIYFPCGYIAANWLDGFDVGLGLWKSCFVLRSGGNPFLKGILTPGKTVTDYAFDPQFYVPDPFIVERWVNPAADAFDQTPKLRLEIWHPTQYEPSNVEPTVVYSQPLLISQLNANRWTMGSFWAAILQAVADLDPLNTADYDVALVPDWDPPERTNVGDNAILHGVQLPTIDLVSAPARSEIGFIQEI